MNLFNFWQILDIEITNDVKLIKRAYAKKTKQFHPEDHPEDFKKLQEAYKLAIAYAKSHKNNQVKETIEYYESDDYYLEDTNSNIKKTNNSSTSIIDSIFIEDNNKPIKHKLVEIDIQIGDTKKEKQTRELNINSDEEIGAQNKTEQSNLLQQYHLDKISMMLKAAPTSITIDKIFLDKYVNSHLADELFKDKVEKIIIKSLKVFNQPTITYIHQVSKQLDFNKLAKLTEPKKYYIKYKAWILLSIISFLFYGIELIVEHTNKPFNSESQNKIIEHHNDNTIHFRNSKYLHDVRVSQFGDSISLYVGENKLFDDIVIEEVTYTLSHLLVLTIEGKYYIFNTENKQLIETSYLYAERFHVHNYGIPNINKYSIVVSNEESVFYLIDNDGNIGNTIIVENNDFDSLHFEADNYYLR